MHRQKVTLAVKVPRPWDLYDLSHAIEKAEREADRQGISEVSWRVLEPDSQWHTHYGARFRVQHHIEHPTIAIYGEGWAWKE